MKAATIIKLFFLICLAALPSACNQYDPFNPDTANLEGIWALDNSTSRRADEEPVWKRLEVYATHMEFSPGQGRWGTQGKWRGDGFWCEVKDGSGEIETVKIISDDAIELHLAAFYPGNSEVLTLYKVRGNDKEMQALATKYPQNITYPPPQGVISVGMTEYQLTTLPWKADQVMPVPDDPSKFDPNSTGFRHSDKADDATIYSYRSDNPSLIELKVTVKNHKVIAVSGGNG